MSRPITTHQALPINAVNKQLEVTHEDGPIYHVRSPGRRHVIRFQEGTVLDAGLNGLSVEALLAICADRLEQFRAGGLGGQYNEDAIAHIREAMFHLHARTTDRVLRGVEGTMAP